MRLVIGQLGFLAELGLPLWLLLLLHHVELRLVVVSPSHHLIHHLLLVLLLLLLLGVEKVGLEATCRFGLLLLLLHLAHKILLLLRVELVGLLLGETLLGLRLISVEIIHQLKCSILGV